MCGRFTLIEWEEIGKRYQVEIKDPILPRYNIAPAQKTPVIISTDKRRLVFYSFGLIPSWAEDASAAYKMINARMETVAVKKSFRHILRSKRCIIPASGFFEWKKEGREKVPYYFTAKNGGLLSLAGLWDCRLSPAKEEEGTFAIITCPANSLVGAVHPRMPVILPREAESIWLDPHENNPGRLQAVLGPAEASVMACVKVSGLVNSVYNDAEDIIFPA